VEIVHAFVLTVWIGLNDDKRKVSDDMFFESVDRCVYFAKRLHAQGQNVTAVCLPVKVGPEQEIYR